MLYRVQSTALGQSGLSLSLLPGASVTVRDKDGAIAMIYSDDAGATSIPNPTTADSAGGYDFYVVSDDFYDISVSANGQTIDERIYPLNPSDVSDAIAAGVTATEQAGISTAQAVISTAQAVAADASATSAQEWAESDTAPGDPGTKSAKTWAEESEASATSAALYGTPKFATIALMAASDALINGQTYAVDAGFNDEREYFTYYDSLTTTADEALIVTADAGGRLISQRTTYANYGEMYLDERTLDNGTRLSVWNVGDFVVDPAGVTLSGGLKVTSLGVHGALNPAAFGCSTTATAAANDAALTVMYGLNPAAVIYDEVYPSAGDFPRLPIPHYGEGGWLVEQTIPAHTQLDTTAIAESTSTNTIYANSFEKSRAAVFFVKKATGSDTTGSGLTVDTAFATPERAVYSLPYVLDAQQTVFVDGSVNNVAYNTLDVHARDAVLNLDGLTLLRRTAQATVGSAKVLTGSLIFKGINGATIETDPGASLTYGLYGADTKAGFMDLPMNADSSGTTNSVVTANRGSYLHLLRCPVSNSTGSGNAVVIESNSMAEIIDSDVVGNTVIYEGCTLSYGAPNLGSSLDDVFINGTLSVAVGAEIDGAISISGAGVLAAEGTSGDRVIINGATTATPGATINLTYADVEDSITAQGSHVTLRATYWQDVITMIGGDLLATDASRSYTPGNTQSSVAQPIIAKDGAAVVIASSVTMKNSAGALINSATGVNTLTPAANSVEMQYTPQGRYTHTIVAGSGANRTGITLGAVAVGGPTSIPPMDGAIWELSQYGTGYSVQIVNSTTALIPGGSITVGLGDGEYLSAVFVWRQAISKWVYIGAKPWPQTSINTITDMTVTPTSGTLPTPDGGVTIADAAAPTNDELLEYCTELRDQLVDMNAELDAVKDILDNLGLTA